MGPPHAHFYCTGCGSIEDVDYRLPEGVLGSLAERHHVAITGETLTFDGRCKTCLEAPATI
jgi:Fe2+ or Zn2+ uptake regulation protein